MNLVIDTQVLINALLMFRLNLRATIAYFEQMLREEEEKQIASVAYASEHSTSSSCSLGIYPNEKTD